MLKLLVRGPTHFYVENTQMHLQIKTTLFIQQCCFDFEMQFWVRKFLSFTAAIRKI